MATSYNIGQDCQSLKGTRLRKPRLRKLKQEADSEGRGAWDWPGHDTCQSRKQAGETVYLQIGDLGSITTTHTAWTKLQYQRPPLGARKQEEAAGTVHLSRSAHSAAQLSGHISIGTVPRWRCGGSWPFHTPLTHSQDFFSPLLDLLSHRSSRSHGPARRGPALLWRHEWLYFPPGLVDLPVNSV